MGCVCVFGFITCSALPTIACSFGNDVWVYPKKKTQTFISMWSRKSRKGVERVMQVAIWLIKKSSPLSSYHIIFPSTFSPISFFFIGKLCTHPNGSYLSFMLIIIYLLFIIQAFVKPELPKDHYSGYQQQKWQVALYAITRLIYNLKSSSEGYLW